MSSALPASDPNRKVPPFLCRYTVSRVLRFGLLGLLMTGGSYWCTTQPQIKAQIAGWAGLVLFGGGSLIAIPRMLMHGGPVVLIDQGGIDDRRGKLGKIEWTKVTRVWIGTIKSTEILCVALHDEEPYLAKLSGYARAVVRASKSMGFPMLTITFAGTDRSVREAIQYIGAVAPDLLR